MKQKILLFSLIAVLIATAAGGTAAYFNAQYTARNVITAGNISIELLERMQREENGATVLLKIRSASCRIRRFLK